MITQSPSLSLAQLAAIAITTAANKILQPRFKPYSIHSVFPASQKA
jgi:hypothetical protein